ALSAFALPLLQSGASPPSRDRSEGGDEADRSGAVGWAVGPRELPSRIASALHPHRPTPSPAASGRNRRIPQRGAGASPWSPRTEPDRGPPAPPSGPPWTTCL